MDNATALRLAQVCFPNAHITTVTLRSKARLWAGMGNIYQVQCSSSSSTSAKTVIVKFVHPRLGTQSRLSIGDQRKLDSYLVEANFYEHHAAALIEDHKVPLPPPYYVERQLDDASNPTIIICMGQLYNSPPKNMSSLDDIHTQVVQWLATFHAATWHCPPTGTPTGSSHTNGITTATTTSVQSVGSYWHLDTRPEEWKDMARSGWQGRLKLAARAIDERLKRDSLQCWVHGDTKDANILYDATGQLAFCDFQYVGQGPPSRDLSYYFCSSHVDDLEEQDVLLEVYWRALTRLLHERNASSDDQIDIPTRQQLDDSMELAFCDFCRFMCGWGFWGYDLSAPVKATLDKLDGGKAFKSETEYDDAVRRVFG